jgi:hypothetical protein
MNKRERRAGVYWLMLATSLSAMWVTMTPTPVAASHDCTASGMGAATCDIPTANSFTCDANQVITVTVTASGGSRVSGHTRCPRAGLGGKGAIAAFVNQPSGTTASSANSPVGLDNTGVIGNNTVGECGGSQANGNIDQTITVSCTAVAAGGGGGAPSLSQWGAISLAAVLLALGIRFSRRPLVMA